MRRSIILFFAFLLSFEAFAVEIKGLVVDENNDPLSFASVFLEDSPQIGTVTDDNGRFSLEVDVTTHVYDTLMISYVGYKEYRKSLFDISVGLKGRSASTVLKFKMVPENQYIKEAMVTASKRKLSKKKEMADLLSRVQQQINFDFPMKDRQFKIKADLYARNGGTILGVEEDVGILSEIYKRSKGEISYDAEFKPEYHKYSLAPEIEKFASDSSDKHLALNKKDLTRNEKKEAAKLQQVLAESMDKNSPIVVQGVGVLWVDRVIYSFETFAKQPGNWEINEVGDDVLLLIFTEKKNIPGIMKYNYQLVFRVDSHSYSIASYYQKLNAALSIPFGYKLQGDELELFNILSMTGMEVDAFKIKKCNVDVENNAFFVKKGDALVPSEKSFTAVGSALDKKNKGITLNGAVKMVVL